MASDIDYRTPKKNPMMRLTPTAPKKAGPKSHYKYPIEPFNTYTQKNAIIYLKKIIKNSVFLSRSQKKEYRRILKLFLSDLSKPAFKARIDALYKNMKGDYNSPEKQIELIVRYINEWEDFDDLMAKPVDLDEVVEYTRTNLIDDSVDINPKMSRFKIIVYDEYGYPFEMWNKPPIDSSEIPFGGPISREPGKLGGKRRKTKRKRRTKRKSRKLKKRN